jgi:two-component system cell cycle sensor histidine kinase/response regulator CckA
MAWLGALACVGLGLLALRPELGGEAREPVVAVIAAIGLAACVTLIGRVGGRARGEARTQALADLIDADDRARLVLDAEGREILRNTKAEAVFGPAEDPAAPLVARIRGDERAAEELGRLATAARQGGAYRTEVWLPRDSGGDWLALEVQALSGGAVQWMAEDVSARRAIEETQRAENELFADFIDFMPVGFYSADVGGRLRFVNQRLAEWLGRRVDELVGKDIAEVLGILPDPEEESIALSLAGRGGDEFQAVITQTVFDEGGETFTRSIVVREETPEQQWQRELNTAERRFRWLFDDAPVGIALVDPDSTVNVCNPAFAAMVAEVAGEVAGRPIADFIHEEDRGAVAEQLGRVLLGASPGTHLPMRLIGPVEVSATLYISPTAEDGTGSASGLMLHFIDTTEQKNLEIRFAQSQKMQAMGQLAGGVAHDFNNLLTAMIGFCDLLLQRHGPGDASFADIMQIKQNANRAASLVRQLLAFSRRQTLQPRLFDITDALADFSNLLRRLMGEAIELTVTHGRDLGLVRVDPGQFDQVIINLAVNARDAMPGGGALSIVTRAVTVEKPFQYGAETMPPGNYVQIEVADTGTGISPENLPRIFEPFFSTKAIGHGTGLGLSTVYGILRQTDGFIFVDSAPGQGTTFHIFLPRFEPAPEAVEARIPVGPHTLEEIESVEVTAASDLTGAGTILIVEDEDAVRLFGARALRNKGYKVLEARDGEGALDILRHEPRVDVLVSDVVMPGMDGVTLARLVKMERPDIRVILMSGYAEDVAPGLVGGEGGIHFLPKPFSLKQLAGKVKEVLAEPAGAQ